MTELALEKPLLEIRDLEVAFQTQGGPVRAVQGASLTLYPGQSVAIVGESGSGKSTLAHAIINLLPGTGKVTGGSISFDGRELTELSKRDYTRVRGAEIGLVPQDPMSNLNPVWSIGFQVREALKANNIDPHTGLARGLADTLASAESPAADHALLSSKGRTALLAAMAAKGTSPSAPGAAKELEDSLVAGSTTLARVGTKLREAGVPDVEALLVEVAKYSASTSDRVAGLLSEAGLPDAARRAKQYPHEFSGGMRQRALIAIGLAARPKLLIADEPTSALDVTVQRKILDHLAELTEELGTAVLFITHDLGLAAERAEHLVVMYRGKVVESGPSREILANPQHPYTKRLVAAAPSLTSQRIQAAKERGVNATGLISATGGDGVSADRPDILEIRGISKVFQIRGARGAKKEFTAVDDVSFSIKKGTTVALVGESGSGKSTVANIVLNLIDPTNGKIFFEGTDLSTLNKKELFVFRRRVQPIFQNPYGSLDPTFSIYRIIEEPLRLHKVGNKAERLARVRELLDLVALPSDTMRRYPNELSGGQRQRIAIARALALGPDVVVCDEAVSALDVLVQAQILELLGRLQAELELSYLFITHDLAVVRQIADEVCVMQEGKIIERATTDEVFETPREQYTKDLLGAIPGASLGIFA